ncbi:unnamed protein product [Microthlaspi erraticum]|uniref:Uncharacterized protein n=1 Tax=Microthlaspi erraticum TaxID=1685480 RepID=A0A6D2HQY5_9BRAS|nr:unnamed protein product [Microthlaspi erraticum]
MGASCSPPIEQLLSTKSAWRSRLRTFSDSSSDESESESEDEKETPKKKSTDVKMVDAELKHLRQLLQEDARLSSLIISHSMLSKKMCKKKTEHGS